MKRIAIVGGGIAGLSAAYELELARRAGAEVEYELFEASERLGGVLKTVEFDGCIAEAGPDSFLTTKPWARDLAKEVGLEGELIHSQDHSRKTYILNRGKLVPMPEGLMMMVPTQVKPMLATPLLSLGTKLKMGMEYLAPPAPLAEGQDESVASFVSRHYGEETVTQLADPLLAGVYGGSASKLSVRAVLPMFVEMEKKHRSLSRGVLSMRKPASSSAPAPLFTSLRGGMQQLSDAVARQLRSVSIRTGSPITRIERRANGWSLFTAAGESKVNGLILAAPAYIQVELLRPVDNALGEQLSRIDYSSSVVVAMTFNASEVALPGGFGFLVPKTENKRIMACTFVHNKFAGRAPEGKLLLRCFMTGATTESDEQILVAVRKDLADVLEIKAEPRAAMVQRWSRAMAQYEVGHLDRVTRIRESVSRLPGLQLAGNALGGIGIPDCIREGRNAAKALLSA